MKIKSNLNKLLAKISVASRFSRVVNKPLFMMVEPTNYCNLKCPLCPTGAGTLRAPKGFMDFEKYKGLIDELSQCLISLQLWGFGEPLMHPRIWDMVEFADKKGIFTKISTNGQFIRSCADAEACVLSGLDRMIISLDGASQETLQKYRINAKFEEILAGINYLNEIKNKRGSQTPELVLQFIVMRHNQHEIQIMKELANSLGAKYRQKTASIATKDGDEISDYLPDKKYSRYVNGLNGKISVRSENSFPRVCKYPWLWAHVCWDGAVVPCCKDPHRDHCLGNAFERAGFLGVWNCKKYREFRMNYLSDRTSLTRCKRCDKPAAI